MTKRWSDCRIPILSSSLQKRIGGLALTIFGMCFSAAAIAQIPPAGTVISNTASSTQLVGLIPQSLVTNSVAVTVGGVVSVLPQLTKSFVSSSIPVGSSTPLNFRLTNSAGNPAQAGITFVDTLPSGLRLTPGATATVVGIGCAATVTLTAPSTISVTSATMNAGTATCDIAVNGITNVAAANADCATSPPAFTNGPGSISGIANATNGVTNQCLVVAPFLTVVATPICVKDTIYVDYTVTPVGVGAPAGVTIDWQKMSGQAVSTLTNMPLTGRLLWPGAAVDSNGNPIAWPGWVFVNGTYQPVNDGLRPDMRMIFMLNPTSTVVVVSYPPATPACSAEPMFSTKQNLDMALIKSLSANSGSSPSGSHTVRIRYSNVSHVDGRKTDVAIVDALPAGMLLVPGTLRLLPRGNLPAIALAGSSGSFTAHGASATYSAAGNLVNVGFSRLEQGEWGLIEFDMTIAPGIAVDSVLRNTAHVTAVDFEGKLSPVIDSNTSEFRVVGTEAVILRGMTLAVVDPGSTVTFKNLLTNNGMRPDTFDITLTGSNYPVGTVLKLFQSDGVSPLIDSSGNGVPDTGVVPLGATYKIVVKAQLPNGSSGGPYSVTKNAQSVSNPLVIASDADVVSTIGRLCKMTLEPSNSGRVAPGDSIVYTHILTNIGNCQETVSVPADFLGNLSAGWTAQAFVDNPVAGGQSIVGVLDAGDQGISRTTTLTVAPGERVLLLVRVNAPGNAPTGATNSTSFRIVGGTSGVLTVGDTTTVLAGSIGSVSDEITGFIDSRFLRPTVWGFIGKPLYLRANAPSCNAEPTIIERRTIVLTGPGGEREEIIATETGPNTGMFVADPINIRLPPVVPDDKVLEGRPYDTVALELIGCGKKITTTITLIDPNGVVFDSRTNQPIAGATVRLVTAAGGTCTNIPANVSTISGDMLIPAPSVVVTGTDGRFVFPLVSPGDYCALVTPPNGYTWTSKVAVSQLPPGRNVIATGATSGGSYGGTFRLGPETGPVIVDIPVDGGLIGGLFVQKTVLRTVVEVGEFIEYIVNVKNNTGYALDQSDVLLTDLLPAGFSYAAGSTRKDGQRVADPKGGAGPRLEFNLGHMTLGQQLRISYKIRVGPGAMQGDGVNRAIAIYRLSGGSTLYSESNVATAKVAVVGGVFTDRGYVVGKVLAYCTGDDIQAAYGTVGQSEIGVPGVRLYLEDGTNVITDSEGKFSFYGLLPRTHVLKIDRTTLPAGTELKDLANVSSRNLGKGDSRIVDLKHGELHKANFEISACKQNAMKDITQRRLMAASLKQEFEGRLQQRLETDPNLRAANDIKALPASGVVGDTAPIASTAAPSSLGAPVVVPASSNTTGALTPRFDSLFQPAPTGAPKWIIDRPAKEPEIPLESVLSLEDNSLGFIGLRDADVLAFAQTTIRVKGTAGATFKLIINGKEIAEERVGKRVVIAEKKSQAWEYLGVNLVVGENALTVRQFDAFGNARGEMSIKVIAPGPLARLTIDFPQIGRGSAIADGKTPVKVVVLVSDAKGVPVTSRTSVTLFASAGRWTVEDLSAVEPGIQTYVEGGRAEFELVAPSEPMESLVTASSGDIRVEAKLDFLPELREMIASGVIEGVLSLRKLDARGFAPTRAEDGFEQEIQHVSRSWGDGKRDAAGRAAMFLKGKVKGEYLLTLAYDSDKNTKERLFRDIQPDEFYPIYGDSSIRGFDAQSTGRFYVRIDKNKSYLLYGDFNTSPLNEVRKLSNYSRSLTGIKQHYETGRVSANVFASRDTTRQVIDEFPATGTSGPFVLSRISGLINSEKIEILTRSRNQPSVIIRTLPLSRFVDYELEVLTGRIIFKSPIASLDEELNPISIRITYEVDQGGDDFWAAGADAQFRLSEQVEIGAMIVDDRNPLDKFRMAGVNAIARLADRTFLIAELARTRREILSGAAMRGEKQGNAQRVEFRHVNGDLDVNLYAGRTDRGFDNPSASLASGRKEMGGKLSYRLDEKTRLQGEILHTEDVVAGYKRDGMLITVERTLENGLRLEGGIRHARDSQPRLAVANSKPVDDEFTSVRARITGEVPGLKDAAAYIEAEVDVEDTSRKLAAIGADYRLGNNSRIYARHEFITSLTGPYGLNSQQRQNATVVGLNLDYMKDGSVFSEYRIRDAISGGDAEAAFGLRNLWTLSAGLQLQTGFERIHALSGKGDAEATAITFGLEYTANPLWKGSTRLELRTSRNSDSILSTLAGAAKISRDWTFLGRNTYSLIRNKGLITGENEQDRLQLGIAYRDTDADKWNALGRIEHRTEHDSTLTGLELKRTVELISIHANWQPRRPFTFSGRYAAKWVNDKSNGLVAKNNVQLLSGRAMWDFAPRWDVSLNASTMLGKGTASKHYGIGLELGYMVAENIWISGGYNFFGYRDEDLTSGEYTNQGAFVRLRYKFDEDLFAGGKAGKSITVDESVPAAARGSGSEGSGAVRIEQKMETVFPSFGNSQFK